MSHFSVLVIVGEQPITLEDAEDKVRPLLAPYDENGEWFRDGSKWDWWQIGGRWTGRLSGYKPADDPRNIENCDLCNGTGKRPDLAAISSQEWANECGGCNGCKGKGTRVKWPTAWAEHEGNICRVADIRDGFRPYAIVTPDGKWYDSGSMGWFGCKREDTMNDEAWDDQAKRIMDAHAEMNAVLVDCHV